MRFFPRIAFAMSIHGPSVSGAEWAARRRSLRWKLKEIAAAAVERRPDYYLPVSGSTWKEFLQVRPGAKGEVFYNALRLDAIPKRQPRPGREKKVAGMVGRMADQKDWPSFAAIARAAVSSRGDVEFWGVGADEAWAAENVGENAKYVRWFGSRQDARDLIAQMDVFVMTSKHEQLPTTLLEAFAIGVPVTGFMPEGGTSEVIDLSGGASAIMIEERDCAKAAANVLKILDDPALAASMVAAGGETVHRHFDMESFAPRSSWTFTQGLRRRRGRNEIQSRRQNRPGDGGVVRDRARVRGVRGRTRRAAGAYRAEPGGNG
jgi:glycosyltransferase involved in cell wall biosynthesis